MDATLRELAERKGLLVGAAVSPERIETEETYREVLAREFNCLVAENAMKGRYLQPERGRFHFEEADRMVDFALEHGMKVRGHTLVWHTQQPDWFMDGDFSRSEALEVLREHVQTVVDHFRGRVFAWDVVNEGVGDEGPLLRQNSPWFKAIGRDYIKRAFRWAREADPEALLFYNDYDIAAVQSKTDRVARLVGELLDWDVPIDGVGFQHHVSAQDAPGYEVVRRKMERFGEMGLTVHVTEMDSGIPAEASEEDLELQAEVYGGVVRAALDSGNCPSVTFWGFTDRYSWIPSFTDGEFDHALIFDRDYAPKPAYRAIADALGR